MYLFFDCGGLWVFLLISEGYVFMFIDCGGLRSYFLLNSEGYGFKCY